MRKDPIYNIKIAIISFIFFCSCLFINVRADETITNETETTQQEQETFFSEEEAENISNLFTELEKLKSGESELKDIEIERKEADSQPFSLKTLGDNLSTFFSDLLSFLLSMIKNGLSSLFIILICFAILFYRKYKGINKEDIFDFSKPTKETKNNNTEDDEQS